MLMSLDRCLFRRVSDDGRLSWDVPAVAGFVCDKAAVLGDVIKGTACNVVRFLTIKKYLTLWRLKTYIYIYVCRTAQLTSRCCILNIYSTNILTEYF